MVLLVWLSVNKSFVEIPIVTNLVLLISCFDLFDNLSLDIMIQRTMKKKTENTGKTEASVRNSNNISLISSFTHFLKLQSTH